MTDHPDSNSPPTTAAAPVSIQPDARAPGPSEPERPAVAPSDPEKDAIAAWLDTFADAPDDDAPLVEGRCCGSRKSAHPDALRASPLPTGGRVTAPSANGSAESESVAPVPANATTQWEPRVFAAPLSAAQQADWREVARREHYGPWLTEIFDRMATVEPLSEEERRALRLYSDILALWALCEEPACRRERTCRGREPLCFGAVGDLVPVCALPFLAGFVTGQRERLPFDAMLAQLPEGAAQHWATWRAAVAQILAPPARVRPLRA